jgi:hypothetical protein
MASFPERARNYVLVALCALPLAGCLARQVEREGKQFRQALIGMYTDQVLDNLIRAYNNQPFVQVKYSELTVKSDATLTATADVNQQISTVRDLGLLPTVAGAVLRTLSNTYDLKANGARDDTLYFRADPVTKDNEIYDYYIAFAHNPAFFVASEAAPACEAHIARKCGHTYYWVPKEAGPAFLELCMRTTFQRGKEQPVVPPVAYELQIVSARKVSLVAPKESDAINAVIVFNHPVPNVEGELSVVLSDGRKVRLRMLAVDLDGPAKAPPDPCQQTTERLRSQWSPTEHGFAPEELNGRPARFYSTLCPPPMPTEGLSPLQLAVQELRANRLGSKAGGGAQIGAPRACP